MSKYQKEAIAELVPKMQSAGFRVFLAESGTHGFYTDTDGTRVISFQVDYFTPVFSGNYKTNQPSQCGTGWRITDEKEYTEEFDMLFNSSPPRWAIRDASYTLTTLDQHLDTYQRSSKYHEVQ